LTERVAREHHPDVVLTDLDMPGLTGLQLCAAIRAEPVLTDVPVGILSGSLHPGDPRAGEAHACGVWLKPCPNAELVAAVTSLAAAGRHDHRAVPSPCPLAVSTA
jgi:CheY-like chemotaxis protein